MNWIILIGIYTIFESLRIFIDNYSSDVFFKDKGATSQKLFCGYFYIIFSTIVCMIFGFDFIHAPIQTVVAYLISGMLSSFSGIPYYKALEIDDSTNLTIFYQLAPIFYLLFGWLFKGEIITLTQFLSFAIVLSAPLLIIKTSRKNSQHIRLKAAILICVSLIISVLGNLIFVYADGGGVSFMNGLALMYFFKGITNISIVYSNKYLTKRYRTVMKKNRKKLTITLLIDNVVYVIKDFAYRESLLIAPAVAIASLAGDTMQPIVMFFMGIFLTLIWPNFGREKLDRKNVVIHLLAIVIAVAGMLVMKFA